MVALLLSTLALILSQVTSQFVDRPHIVYIMADDLVSLPKTFNVIIILSNCLNFTMIFKVPSIIPSYRIMHP